MSFLMIFMKFLYFFCIFAWKVNKVQGWQTAKAPSGVIPEGAFCMYSIFKFFDV